MLKSTVHPFVTPVSASKNHSGRFLDRLEALRGVAALWVIVSHSMIWLAMGDETALWSKSIFDVHGGQAVLARAVVGLFNGAAAVDIFFVLSGFVLARSLRDNTLTPGNYARFVVRRVFRIFPAFWLSLAVVVLYLVFVFPGYAELPGASKWFNWAYAEPLSARQLWQNISFYTASLNSNAWTLKIEMAASLCLPFVVWCIGWRGMTRAWATLAVAIAASLWTTTGWAWLAGYMYMFAAGAIISRQAVRTDSHLASSGRFLMLCAAFIVIPGFCWPTIHIWQADFPIVLGASGIIWAIAASPKSYVLRFLDSAWARFLGKISYSFYILGFITLYVVANWCLHKLPLGVLQRWPLPIMAVVCIVAVALTMVLATASFYWIEKPLTVLGRRLTRPHALEAPVPLQPHMH